MYKTNLNTYSMCLGLISFKTKKFFIIWVDFRSYAPIAPMCAIQYSGPIQKETNLICLKFRGIYIPNLV